MYTYVQIFDKPKTNPQVTLKFRKTSIKYKNCQKVR